MTNISPQIFLLIVGLFIVLAYGAVWEFCFLGISDILLDGRRIKTEASLMGYGIKRVWQQSFVTLTRKEVENNKIAPALGQEGLMGGVR